jgi:HK97 family phage major capsid protein
MEYILTGKIPEKRADAITLTTDASAVVPNTIMKRVIKELKEYGQIWARITKSNVKGGISIPVATLKPKATWVGENTVADKQKYPVNSNVSFLYHKLKCRVAISLEVDTTTLEVFEDSLVDAMKEAMIVALEQAVLNGTGNKQPLGITKHENVKVVELTEEEIRTYRGWIKAKKAVPASYKKRISFILNDSDFTNYIEGMVDSNGQPVGRVNYGLNGEETTKVLGKEAILVEDDYLPSFDTAEAGTVFGVICDLSDYLFNSNMEIVIKRYFDEDLDQWITKATLIGDGKMSSTQSVVLLKKKATSTKADGEGKGTQETPQV